MRRTGDTLDARYEAELVLIEFFALLVLLFLLSSGPAPAPVSHAGSPPAAVQPAAAPTPAKAVEQPAETKKPAARHIARRRRVVVSIPDRKLAVVEEGKVVKVYPVAVGAATSPSPKGEFTIVYRAARPSYKHKGHFIPPGQANPLGPRWLGLSKAHYGIHGTNDPNSIGHAASGGCIRMKNDDIQELYAAVEVGDAVEIHGERDPGLDRIFGETAPAQSSADGVSAPAADADQQL